MKFNINIELDTNDDREIASELLELVTLVKLKLEDFNADDIEDDWEDEEEEVIQPPKRKYRRRQRK
jgi:hypothetical protein